MSKNKRIIAIFLSLMMLISSGIFVNNAHAAQAKPTVYAHSYTVMDANSGEIIISEQENKRIYPASTIKLLTAIVAIENCSLYKRITVKKSTLNKVDVETTTAGLKPGYAYTLEELLNMLLVYSAGDAAEIIAESVGGTRENFVEMMNIRAKELGMNDSYFDNPVGMDWHKNANIYSTSSDIAKLTRYAMTNDTIRAIVKKPQYVIKNYYKGKSKTLYASNNFLRNYSYSKNLFTIIGSKTGTSDKAGYALSATARDSSGREVICAFFANGVLTMTSSGKFSGSTQVSKKEFVTTTNKALKTSYVVNGGTAKITLLDVAKIFKDYNSKEYSQEIKNKYKNRFKNLNSTDFNNMVHLYELNILPHDYGYNANAKISRQEMVLMLNNMPQRVQSLKTFSIFTVNRIRHTSTIITGKGLKNARVKASVNGKQIGKTVTVDIYGKYKIKIPKQKKKVKIVVTISKTGYKSKSKTIIVK